MFACWVSTVLYVFFIYFSSVSLSVAECLLVLELDEMSRVAFCQRFLRGITSGVFLVAGHSPFSAITCSDLPLQRNGDTLKFRYKTTGPCRPERGRPLLRQRRRREGLGLLVQGRLPVVRRSMVCLCRLPRKLIRRNAMRLSEARIWVKTRPCYTASTT